MGLDVSECDLFQPPRSSHFFLQCRLFFIRNSPLRTTVRSAAGAGREQHLKGFNPGLLRDP